MPNRVRKNKYNGQGKFLWDLNYALCFVLKMIGDLPENLASQYAVTSAAIKLEVPEDFQKHSTLRHLSNYKLSTNGKQQMFHVIEKFGYRFTFEHMSPEDMSPFDYELFNVIRRRWDKSVRGAFLEWPEQTKLRIVSDRTKK